MTWITNQKPKTVVYDNEIAGGIRLWLVALLLALLYVVSYYFMEAKGILRKKSL